MGIRDDEVEESGLAYFSCCREMKCYRYMNFVRFHTWFEKKPNSEEYELFGASDDIAFGSSVGIVDGVLNWSEGIPLGEPEGKIEKSFITLKEYH